MCPAIIRSYRFAHNQSKNRYQFLGCGTSLQNTFEMLENAGFGTALNRQRETDKLVCLFINWGNLRRAYTLVTHPLSVISELIPYTGFDNFSQLTFRG